MPVTKNLKSLVHSGYEKYKAPVTSALYYVFGSRAVEDKRKAEILDAWQALNIKLDNLDMTDEKVKVELCDIMTTIGYSNWNCYHVISEILIKYQAQDHYNPETHPAVKLVLRSSPPVNLETHNETLLKALVDTNTSLRVALSRAQEAEKGQETLKEKLVDAQSKILEKENELQQQQQCYQEKIKEIDGHKALTQRFYQALDTMSAIRESATSTPGTHTLSTQAPPAPLLHLGPAKKMPLAPPLAASQTKAHKDTNSRSGLFNAINNKNFKLKKTKDKQADPKITLAASNAKTSMLAELKSKARKLKKVDKTAHKHSKAPEVKTDTLYATLQLALARRHASLNGSSKPATSPHSKKDRKMSR